jgi:hypothetical protein
MDAPNLFLSAVVGGDSGPLQLRMTAFSQENLTQLLKEGPAAITVSPFGELIPERLLELVARHRAKARFRRADVHSLWRAYCRSAHESALHFERIIVDDELTRWHMPERGGLVAFVQVTHFDFELDEAIVSRVTRQSDEPSAESLEVHNYRLLKQARAQMLQRVETYTSVELAAISQSSNVNSSAYAADLRRAGKVLGVRSGREWLYPRFQFDAGLKPVRPFPEVKTILAALPPDSTGWDHLQWFLDPNSLLSHQSPLEVWHINRGQVVQAAQKGKPDDRD